MLAFDKHSLELIDSVSEFSNYQILCGMFSRKCFSFSKGKALTTELIKYVC